MIIQFDEEKYKLKLKNLRRKEEEEFLALAASRQGIGYINLFTTPIDTDALRLIPENTAREAKVAAFKLLDKKVDIAAVEPNGIKVSEIAEMLKRREYHPTIYLASPESVERAWSKYKEISFALETKSGALDISNEEITSLIENVKTTDDISNKINEVLADKKSYRITRVVEIMIAGGLALEASDIHVEPEEDYVRLRYRLDGVLNEVLRFDRETLGLIISRVKLLSGLKLNIKHEAQDGRFSVRIKETDIEIRTSVIPGAYGESIVLRILNPKSISVPLEELGINDKLLNLLLEAIKRPNGMILTTGPTGSGKTTTLYAFLRKIYAPEVKIITIENPIEYHIPGIVQTQTDPDGGYTFEAGLRSILRQDPDVIMVGEIRDGETAEIAVNAALTGHLVFSTLHTNNAAGAFPRLIDLGVNPKVISSAVTVAIAQRLVRKLCQRCRKKYQPPAEEKAVLERIIGNIFDEKYKTTVKEIYRAGECDACNHTGYKGRIGIFEAILIDKNVEEVVLQNPSDRDIMEAARPQGILSMVEDGVLKVLSGITSLEELKRVVSLEEDWMMNETEKKPSTPSFPAAV
jgi:type IV pilus assembly protein PilB